ncbi:MAG: hypothetical protein JNK82_33825 [Myxococcaceae bacterium]|nr:hypothetical protein [Myxococcaceae bacterium]
MKLPVRATVQNANRWRKFNHSSFICSEYSLNLYYLFLRTLGMGHQCTMHNQPLVDLVLRPHQVHLQLSDGWSRTRELTLSLPDLRAAVQQGCGDWGPWYSVSVTPSEPLRVSVGSRSIEAGRSISLELAALTLESPMLCETRSKTPLFFDIPVEPFGVRLQIYYDRAGLPADVRVAQLPHSSRDASAFSAALRPAPPRRGDRVAPRVAAVRRSRRASSAERR